MWKYLCQLDLLQYCICTTQISWCVPHTQCHVNTHMAPANDTQSQPHTWPCAGREPCMLPGMPRHSHPMPHGHGSIHLEQHPHDPHGMSCTTHTCEHPHDACKCHTASPPQHDPGLACSPVYSPACPTTCTNTWHEYGGSQPLRHPHDSHVMLGSPHTCEPIYHTHE